MTEDAGEGPPEEGMDTPLMHEGAQFAGLALLAMGLYIAYKSLKNTELMED